MDQDKDVATQPDATAQGEQVTQAVSPRQAAIDAIRAQRNAKFEEETGVKVERVEMAPIADDAEPAKGQPVEQEPVKEPAAADLSVSAQLGKQLDDGTIELSQEDLKRIRVRAKVDGEDIVVEGSKALGQYQKGAAAEVRLEKATQAQREAEMLLEEARARAAAATTATDAKKATQDIEAASKELEAKQKEFLDALYGGDVEKAGKLFSETVAAAVDQAMSGRTQSATPVDTAAIAKQAAELAVPVVEQVASRKSALSQLKGDYPEIFTDPDYAFLTDRRINQLIAEGKTEAEAIVAGGVEIAQKFGLKKSSERQPQPGSTTARAERLAAKKEGLDEPKATAARAASQAPAPKTPSQIIADIAAARAGVRV